MKTTPTVLCSDVLHVVLLRSHQVPIELRKIIIDDYLPFLIQDYARDLLKVADLLELKRLASQEDSHSKKRFYRNVIKNLAASNPNDSYFQLEFNPCPFKNKLLSEAPEPFGATKNTSISFGGTIPVFHEMLLQIHARNTMLCLQLNVSSYFPKLVFDPHLKVNS